MNNVINPIAQNTRLALSLVSLAVLLGWLVVPLDVTWNFRDAAIPGILVLLTSLTVIYQCLRVLQVIKPIVPGETLGLTLYVLTIWTFLALHVVQLQLTPGNYGNVSLYPESLLHIELFPLLAGFGIALLAHSAPRPSGEPTARRSTQVRSIRATLSRKRKSIALATSLLFVGFLVADNMFTASAIETVNACVLRRFDSRWSIVYRENPVRRSMEWEFPAGAERPFWELYSTDANQDGVTEEWLRKIPTSYEAPSRWTDFVQVVAVTGIPAIVRRDGIEERAFYPPLALESMGAKDEGPNWNFFVQKLNEECRYDFEPSFPISMDALWNSPRLIDEISEIPGYVRVEDDAQ